MLYSIIPPILVIVSLIGIILFLMRKSSKVAEIELEDFSAEGETNQPRKSFLKKVFSHEKKENVKGASLAVLERLTRWFRLMFLKLESRFSHWSNRIREKRKQRFLTKEQAKAEKEKSQLAEIEKTGRESALDKLMRYKININKKEEKPGLEPEIEIKEKDIKPMISERMVVPQMKAEMKDRLEELLIERIAANPRDVEAYERLGEYYMEIKNFQDAKECYKQVIKLDPLNRSARYKMRKLEFLLSR
ncbi:MAG: tetratricopeptide repeat protein [Candidatus Moranbacteria bacterium]|nr:tetratricopeptide repeat protein [Candidatus Moranbacteria bacterium]